MALAQQPKSIPDIVQELWELLKNYARQRTVDPLKGLGRYLGFGIGGAALLSLGFFFLTMSALRALQTETGDVFTGWLSAMPYLIVLVVAVLVAALAAMRISKGNAKGKGARE
jgi:hypothetical protein